MSKPYVSQYSGRTIKKREDAAYVSGEGLSGSDTMNKQGTKRTNAEMTEKQRQELLNRLEQQRISSDLVLEKRVRSPSPVDKFNLANELADDLKEAEFKKRKIASKSAGKQRSKMAEKNPDGYKCDICAKITVTAWGLEKHIKARHGLGNPALKAIPVQLPSQNRLPSAIKKGHTTSDESSVEQSSGSENESECGRANGKLASFQRFECNICSKLFPTESKVNIHYQRAHIDATGDDSATASEGDLDNNTADNKNLGGERPPQNNGQNKGFSYGHTSFVRNARDTMHTNSASSVQKSPANGKQSAASGTPGDSSSLCSALFLKRNYTPRNDDDILAHETQGIAGAGSRGAISPRAVSPDDGSRGAVSPHAGTPGNGSRGAGSPGIGSSVVGPLEQKWKKTTDRSKIKNNNFRVSPKSAETNRPSTSTVKSVVKPVAESSGADGNSKMASDHPEAAAQVLVPTSSKGESSGDPKSQHRQDLAPRHQEYFDIQLSDEEDDSCMNNASDADKKLYDITTLAIKKQLVPFKNEVRMRSKTIHREHATDIEITRVSQADQDTPAKMAMRDMLPVANRASAKELENTCKTNSADLIAVLSERVKAPKMTNVDGSQKFKCIKAADSPIQRLTNSATRAIFELQFAAEKVDFLGSRNKIGVLPTYPCIVEVIFKTVRKVLLAAGFKAHLDRSLFNDYMKLALRACTCAWGKCARNPNRYGRLKPQAQTDNCG